MLKKKRNYRIITLIAIFVIFLAMALITQLNVNEYNVIITDKEINVSKNKDSMDSRYLVFTELNDGETKVFQNTDILVRGKFNSSDLQGQMKIGEKYTIKTVGYRIPILSTYENIIDVSK